MAQVTFPSTGAAHTARSKVHGKHDSCDSMLRAHTKSEPVKAAPPIKAGGGAAASLIRAIPPAGLMSHDSPPHGFTQPRADDCRIRAYPDPEDGFGQGRGLHPSTDVDDAAREADARVGPASRQDNKKNRDRRADASTSHHAQHTAASRRSVTSCAGDIAEHWPTAEARRPLRWCRLATGCGLASWPLDSRRWRLS